MDCGDSLSHFIHRYTEVTIMRKMVVLGGGESGVGAAVLGAKNGFDVLLSDAGEIQQKYKDVLLNNEIETEEKGHSVDRILSADMVVKSPGIPDTVPLVKQLMEAGIPVISEVELASRYCKGKVIGITGSNGKTTTSSLIHHLLITAGLDSVLVGNIGDSFAMSVAKEKHDFYVVELSSFQLDGIDSFAPDIALLLNISPDHLDRYDYDLSKYVDAKFRITEYQLEDQLFIYSNSDELISEKLKNLSVRAIMKSFGLNQKGESRYENDQISSGDFSIDQKELSIKGKHNVANAQAAILAVQSVGVNGEVLAKGLRSFQAIEHRLESVRKKDRVHYINDSKATNVDATYFALEAVEAPIIWVAGGVDKGNDYSMIQELVEQKVKGLICLGRDNQKLLNEFEPKLAEVYEALTTDKAIELANEIVERMKKEGEDKEITVLLSPACASFDLFKNYEDRGNKYKQTIINL